MIFGFVIPHWLINLCYVTAFTLIGFGIAVIIHGTVKGIVAHFEARADD